MSVSVFIYREKSSFYSFDHRKIAEKKYFKKIYKGFFL